MTVRTRHVGAALGFGGSLSGQTDRTPAQFISIVGSRYGTGHFFFGGSIPSSFAASGQGLTAYPTLNGGTRAWVDFELTHYGVNGTYNAGGTPAAGAVTDAANLAAWIADAQGSGLDLRVVLWHEAFNKFNVQATQTLNNLDYANSMGYYGAVLRAAGLPVVFDPSNYSAQNHFSATIGTSGTPGLGWAACAAGYIDEVYTDFYVDQQASGTQGHWDEVATLASNFSLPLGVLEYGVTPAVAPPAFNEAHTVTFLAMMATFLSQWENNSTWTDSGGHSIPTTDVADLVFWSNVDGPGSIVQMLPQNWSANTIAQYQALFDTFDGGTYGGVATVPYTLVSASAAVSSGTTEQVTVTATSNPTDGILVIGMNNITNITGFTDSQGNTYNLVASVPTNGTFRLVAYVALNTTPLVSGVDWIKMTYGVIGSSAEVGFIARGFSNVLTVSAVDTGASTVNSNAGSAAISVGPSPTLATASEWVTLAMMDASSSGAPSAISGGFTQQAQTQQAEPWLTIADLLSTSSSPLTGGATITSGRWSALIAALKLKSTQINLTDVAAEVDSLKVLRLADVAAAADAIAVTVSTPSRSVTLADTAAAAESAFGISQTDFPAVAGVAGAVDGLAVVEHPPPPWALTAIAAGSTTTFIASSTAVAVANVQNGDKFQLYSGGTPLNTNPFFTGGTVGWSAFNGTQAVTASPPSGCPYPNANLYTNNGTTAGALEGSPLPFAVLPGQLYLVSAWVYSSVAGIQIGMDWLNSSHTFLSTSLVSLTVPVSTWTLVTAVVSPKGPNAVFGYPRVGSASLGETIYVAGCVTVPQGLLAQGQVFTITGITGGQLTFTPAAQVATFGGEQALQAVPGQPQVLPSAAPAFIRSAMPRMYAQNILTGTWLNRDVQGVTQPQVTWNLNQPDTFTCVISPPRDDLLDSTGNPIFRAWQTAVYLEENDEIKFGGIVTSGGQNGAQWTLGATGFISYPNGMPYEGDVYKKTKIDALDVVRDLWNWVQTRNGGNLGLQLDLTDSGVLLGAQLASVPVATTLQGSAAAGSKQVAVPASFLDQFTKGMKVRIGDEDNIIASPPAGFNQPGGALIPKTIFLQTKLDHYHKDGTAITQVIALVPFELDWWNSTDVGQEISSIAQEAVFDQHEQHRWQDTTKLSVLHQLKFGVPRIGKRLDGSVRFAEGENITVPAQVDEDGTAYFNNVVGLGAGQGSKQVRVQVSDLGTRLRRTVVYNDQTVKTTARMQVKAQRVLAASTSIDTPTTVIVINHPNAPFGSFGVGDDIPVMLNSGWRKGTIWCRITAMQQDPTTSLMTMTLARSDSFTYIAESGQAGTL